MKNDLATNIVDDVLKELLGRGGFDHWYNEDVDAETQAEIYQALLVAVDKHVVQFYEGVNKPVDDLVSMHLDGV